MPTKIYRLPEVMSITGISKASIYLGIKRGTFPSPVKLGSRAVGWTDESITGWLKQLERVA